MARPFRTSTPHLYNADYIRNKKNKVMYNHMVDIAANNKCSSSDGKTKIDCRGYLLHTNNHETLRSLRYGFALCAPCDISGLVTEPGDISGVLDKCTCRIPASVEMRIALRHILGDHLKPATVTALQDYLMQYGLGPDFFYLPWNPFEMPGGRNASKTWWVPSCGADGLDASGTDCKNAPTMFYLTDASGGRFGSCPFPNLQTLSQDMQWPTDISGAQNILPFLDASGDCSGAACGGSLLSIYGAYMDIAETDSRFGDRCGSTFLPSGTFAFNLHTLISTWLYLWEPIAAPLPASHPLAIIVNAFKKAGIYGARPATTLDNYLSNFSTTAPLRFYRSKYWHTHA